LDPTSPALGFGSYTPAASGRLFLVTSGHRTGCPNGGRAAHRYVPLSLLRRGLRTSLVSPQTPGSATTTSLVTLALLPIPSLASGKRDSPGHRAPAALEQPPKGSAWWHAHPRIVPSSHVLVSPLMEPPPCTCRVKEMRCKHELPLRFFRRGAVQSLEGPCHHAPCDGST
jgi:hypothetical protein